MLSADVLSKLFPAAEAVNIESFAAQSGDMLPKFGISDRRDRLHFFLAQLGHESGGLHVHSENLNYSAARLRVVWPSRFPNLASTNGFAGNPQALANKVYGGRMGNNSPGDGWKYRGRGYIQITGKDGYAQVGSRAGLDLVANPDIAVDPQHCLAIACAFWSWKDVNIAADKGDFVGATRRINGGTTGLQARIDWLRKVQALIAWPLPQQSVDLGDEVPLPLGKLKAVQVKLQTLGFYAGSIDGVFGAGSRTALKVFQAENDLPKNGRITQATLDKLEV